MDEMRLLREHHGARPGPSPEVAAHARALLEERARTASSPVRAKLRWRRYALSAAAGVAAVSLIPLAPINGDPGDRAYAAEALPDGRIKVTFDDLDAPPKVVQRRLDGLERRLDALGVQAVIDFIPFFSRCSVFPRGTFYQDDNDGSPTWTGPERAGDNTLVYIYPGRIKPGRTLVMALSADKVGVSSAVKIGAYVVRGPAKPCDPVPVGRR
ncbi:hypothetical protein E1293_14735 [Actinomadura darangshiensis]|uniref:Uncharacterized protein n=1 Tax=Actinomadura darangshiensis TaxID=705336 RepID=A0A4R5BEZ1_9ACTN|nr:hypothetical protein [Actinomadura darangshiensis]TDD83420.1 hypothetical protein E1293_14735 [Actinomadura darangshiensis]